MMRNHLFLALLALPPILAFGDGVSSVPAFWGGTSTVARGTRSAAVDCRTAFPVAKLVDEPALQNLAYSAIGWDIDPAAAPTRTVTITARPGTLEDGVFTPDGEEIVVMAARTGKGVFDWQPSAVSKTIYRLAHTVSAGGTQDGSALLYGYFDFTHCVCPASQTEVEAAVFAAITQPITVTQDAVSPWQPIDLSTARSGVATDEALLSGTETATTFAFSGRGTLHYDYALGGGTLEVWSDGAKVATYGQATAGWQTGTCAFADYGAHTVRFLYMAAGGGATASLRNVRWEEPSVAGRAHATRSAAVDCRTAFPVAKLVDEPALQNLAYSAIGWDIDPAAAPTRTVTLTARPGTLVDGVFTPDGEEIVVMEARTGKGVFDWQPSTVSKTIYRLAHTVSAGGTQDGSALLYGYFDFSQCETKASQAEVEAAVLGEFTQPITVTQDAVSPWQPIDLSTARSGVATDEALLSGTDTATTFAFSGRGTLHYDYALGGGTLEVWSDGAKVATYGQATAGWQTGTCAFADYGAHTVRFLYTAAGGDATASLRNVRWEEPSVAGRAHGVLAGVRADLQEGVRTPKYLADVLPFVYSSTNWIGDVVGTTDASVARVTVVQLTGTDPCVTNWTDEVAGTYKILRETAGEGEVRWRASVGVWKATFDILEGETGLHRETAFFDLRNARGKGFVITIR